ADVTRSTCPSRTLFRSMTRLSASEQGVPALGYVVSYIALQRALDAALARTSVTVRFGAKVVSVGGTSAYAAVDLAGPGFDAMTADRKSTRLNSSHQITS